MNETRYAAWAAMFILALAILYTIAILIGKNETGLGGPSGSMPATSLESLG
jgi:hypothetical protein